MLLSAGGCSGPGGSNGPGGAEPERVLVQHVLVSFTGKLPGKSVRRNEEEARHLATEILRRAESGEDFDALVKEYTDDSHPGIYGMANRGIVPHGGDEYRREDMVPGFGDVAFGLAPDGVGFLEFDAMKSPFGFHIIKRLQ
jgi:parvulin-like peptidyl-prolyl isomerase